MIGFAELVRDQLLGERSLERPPIVHSRVIREETRSAIHLPEFVCEAVMSVSATRCQFVAKFVNDFGRRVCGMHQRKPPRAYV